MLRQKAVVDEPVYASYLQAGDIFVFVADKTKKEFVVLRTARGGEINGNERCFFIHFLPCLILGQIHDGGDVVTANRRLLCCMREEPDQPHLLVMVVGQNLVVPELAEITSL